MIKFRMLTRVAVALGVIGLCATAHAAPATPRQPQSTPTLITKSACAKNFTRFIADGRIGAAFRVNITERGENPDASIVTLNLATSEGLTKVTTIKASEDYVSQQPLWSYRLRVSPEGRETILRNGRNPTWMIVRLDYAGPDDEGPNQFYNIFMHLPGTGGKAATCVSFPSGLPITDEELPVPEQRTNALKADE